MRFLIILFLLPLYSLGQTIHFDDDEIIYVDTVKLAGVSGAEPMTRLQQAMQVAAEQSKTRLDSVVAGATLTAKGAIRLNSAFRYIVDVHFTLRLAPVQEGYAYTVDSFYVTEKRRAGRTEVFSAKDLIERIEETGAVAIENERMLNEIDLRLQKFLTLLETAVKRGAPAGP